MVIAVYGGSFDPPHSGHAMIASCVSQAEGIDALWLMVSPRNPLKTESELTEDRHRLEMTRLLAGPCRNVEASDFEFNLPVPSYTLTTLRTLREQYPGDSFILVIGSDNWLDFNRWRDTESIINEFGVLIFPRPGYPVDPTTLPKGVRLLRDTPVSEISSTFIRGWVEAGNDPVYLVPPAVADYIRRNRLYAPKNQVGR